MLQFALLVRDTRFLTSEMVDRTVLKSVTSTNSKVSAASSRTKGASIAASRAKASFVLPENALVESSN
jgi:hypothetical protein